ncbi:3-oxosteroid 1-dehydrogenase [Saccharopolyspora endophytica]|uniref:3-oxosteroid 1-dehydrogenase n=1 Tax=Saccharopolyspora endophytica TaxID=543886 RepID=A0ABS5DBT2_9PSEU|nr:3-oxosteroid 1-dehydrogenase [Saccharopolyspora endophytica]MBQ0923733.1 3-oxosteroid 1-dehydrogenase [Saccharopolyspora endophytica]
MTEATFDVVVVGSGAAGMTAALTAADRGLSVLVVEKDRYFGGSTARSGGAVWAPHNEVLRRANSGDSPEKAATYLRHLIGDEIAADRREALLSHGPDMVSLVLRRTPLKLKWIPGYSDYYPETPGGLPEGRTLEPKPFNGKLLGDELANLQPPYLPAPAGITVTAAEYKWMNLIARHPRGMFTSAKVGLRRVVSLATKRPLLALGQALAAGLRAGLLRADVPVWLNSPLTELHVEEGAVTGVRVQRGDEEVLVRARLGVIMAAGGFEKNERMRKQFQREPIGTDWTVGAESNTGDGIEAGQRLGADVDLMDDAWWGPSIPLPRGPYFCLSERNLPGCVLVNAAGQRYVNEATPYVDAVHAMYRGHETGVSHIPSWLVADQRYRNNYTFAGLPPRQRFPGRWYKAGIVHTARTLDELAAKIEVPADQLRATVQRFNGFAEKGTDEDFRRGESAYDRYYGDPRLPNPSLAPLEVAPFHAIKIVPGDLGTKGGLRTDARARVLREDGSTIPGLYAAGNASAAVMGSTYAGAGATIGPAMTFGYVAALDLAAEAEN